MLGDQMGLFSIFKKKKPKADSEFQKYAEEMIAEFQANDFLGKAAEAGHKAKAAVQAKQHDTAWGFYHEQKNFYMQHANRCGFTARQALALDSQVHEDLANILRIEGKSYDALIHILYWVLANNDKPIKRHQQKLSAYFGRCKFKNTSLNEVISFSSTHATEHTFFLAQSKVAEWKAKENGT